MTRLLAVAAAALLTIAVAGCNPNDDEPVPVDPPHCFPHCGTRPRTT